MSKARQNLERRYWAAPNAQVARALWLRMSPPVRKRIQGVARIEAAPPNGPAEPKETP